MQSSLFAENLLLSVAGGERFAKHNACPPSVKRSLMRERDLILNFL